MDEDPTGEERKERMRRAVKSMQKYMATYDQQIGFDDYTDETFINDMLYAVGVALHGKKMEYATGFNAFKDMLRKHLGCEETFFGAWVNTQETNDELERDRQWQNFSKVINNEIRK